MITFPTSFQNANGDEGSAIGHLFWDREIEGTYVEVLQAEDYVLFRIVHESADQRYGFEQFRKWAEFRVTVQAMPAIVNLVRAGVPDEGPYPSVPLYCEYDGDEIGFALTEQGLTVGCKLGDTKILKVRLSEDSTDTLCDLVQAFYDDYQDYLERREFITATLREWNAVLDQLDGNWPSEDINQAIYDASAEHDDDEVTVEVPDAYEAERLKDLMLEEYEWSVDEWRRVLQGLAESRDWDLYNKLVTEFGFHADLSEPNGTTDRSLLYTTLTLPEGAKVQRAAFTMAASGR